MKAWSILILCILFYLSTAAQQKSSIEWQVAALLPAPNGTDQHLGVAGALSGMYNSVLIVGGGANFPQAMPWLGGVKKYHDEVYIYTKGLKGKLNILHTAKLPAPIAYSASCTTPQGVVCAGGEGEEGVTNQVLLLRWNGGIFSTIQLPPLPQAFANGAITYFDGKVYLAGGENSTEALRQFAVLDLKNKEQGWQQLPPLPQATSHAVLVVQGSNEGSKIYLLGGRRKDVSGISVLYKQVYAFNLKTQTWQEEAPLPYALSAGTGVAAGACSVLLFGGDKGQAFNQTEKLIATIKAETDEEKKKVLNRQKEQLQIAHPGFSHDVLAYNTYKRQWQAVSTIPYAAPVTTTAVCWDNRVYLTSGEIKAGVRTPHILAAQLQWNDKGGCR